MDTTMTDSDSQRVSLDDLTPENGELSEAELKSASGGSAGDGFALIEDGVIDALNPILYDH